MQIWDDLVAATTAAWDLIKDLISAAWDNLIEFFRRLPQNRKKIDSLKLFQYNNFAD